MLIKTTFVELSKVANRPFVLFGSGNVAKKTHAKLSDHTVSYIVDNSTNLQGTTFDGLEIKSPENIAKDAFILICSTAISAIRTQLTNLGFKENIDFTISPILNDLLAISELEEIETSFVFTSGTVPQQGEPYGGGLYLCNVSKDNVTLNKVYEGPCYGAVSREKEILFVDTDNGLHSYHEGNVIKLCDLPAGSRAHGISYNADNKRIYITCSYLDAVLELDQSYNIIREFKLSQKLENEGAPVHHCNDNLAVGNSLYVSMFSSTGNWKKDIFDGCIAEFDIATGERLNDVTSGLYMPHNVKIFDNSIHVLDSLPGHLRFNNLSIQGTFPAFTRGLDYKKGHYYIGQSKNRNYSKVLGLSNNISIDCGVVIYNPELKVSRFIQLPHAIGEIHSIVTL